MAIKISGTTVINDSRQLQNVASVDATTAAVIAANAGGGSPRFQEAVTTSGTWSPKMDGEAYLILVGAGGSGGVGRDQLLTSASYINLGGGGAGGMCIHKATLSTSQSYSVTLGAGHTNTQSYGTNVSSGQAGGTGGTSTLSGNGISLTANGGNGGGAASQGRVDTNVAGGTGGTASGANIYNMQGGRGSNCVRAQMSANNYVGGGGACAGTQSVWYSPTGAGASPPFWLQVNSYENNAIPSTDLSAIGAFSVGNVWTGTNYSFNYGSQQIAGTSRGGGGGAVQSISNNGGGISCTSISAGGGLNILYFG